MSTTARAWTWYGSLVFLLATSGAWAQPPGGAGGLYRDRLNGFSLRPPRDGQRTGQRNPAILAQWTQQDPKTGQTFWTLRAYRTTFRNRKANIRDYAQAVKERIGLQPGAKIDDTQFVELAGQPAIRLAGVIAPQVNTDATGVTSKVPDTYFRQAWVLRAPGEFLVLDFVSLDASDQSISAMWAKFLASLKLFDPKPYLLEQKANSQRARAFLQGLTPDVLQAALPNQPQWFLLYKEGKPVGWLCRQGQPKRHNNIAGYEVRSWVMVQLPLQPVRLISQRRFTNPDLSMSAWQGRIQIGSGDRSVLLVEDGLRQGHLILATLADGQRNTNDRKSFPKIPEAVMEIYLPKAVGSLLPTLLDRTQPAAYTFAEYDRQTNDFQMRTVTVVGPEPVEHKGKLRKTVKITDQPAANAEAVTFWVNEKGHVLQTRSPDGVTSVSASAEETLRTYPKARAMIARMNQAERGKITPPRRASKKRKPR